MISIEIQTFLSVAAILISIFSLRSTRQFWFLTHRPIVTAEVIVNFDGVGMAAFDLVLYNSGNRPAVNITLYAEKQDVERILSANITQENKQEVLDVFSALNKIALLLNGKDAKTAFFSFSEKANTDADFLEYEAALPIVISYSDIEGKEYASNVCLFIRGSEGFGGSLWGTT
jgi:hypothetical protein